MDSWVLPSNSQQPIGDDDERFPRDCQGMCVFGVQHYPMPVAHCRLQGRAPLINIQASPWDPTLSRPEYRVHGTARHEHALSVSGIPIHPAMETGR